MRGTVQKRQRSFAIREELLYAPMYLMRIELERADCDQIIVCHEDCYKEAILINVDTNANIVSVNKYTIDGNRMKRFLR